MKKDDDDSLIRSLGSGGEAVLSIGVLSGFGAWGGFQLDQHFHSSPWLAVGLALLGMALGLTRMVMQALVSEKGEAKTPTEKK
jgi:F0F1-type ATP synthase assembly protein I